MPKLHLIPKLRFTKLGKSGDRLMKSAVVRNPVKPKLIQGKGAYKHNSDSEDEEPVRAVVRKIKPLRF